MTAIDDWDRRELIASVVDQFEAIESYKDNVPWQVLHADFNNANIILNEAEEVGISELRWEIAGVLDVGDMVYSPRVNDLAIGIAYMLIASVTEPEDPTSRRVTRPLDPIEAAAAFYGGYASCTPLTIAEKQVLHTLVACRLAISFTFGMYSFSQDPTNEYLLMHAQPAYNALQLWWSTPEPEIQAKFARAMVANAYR